jgi:hypothetical protein
MSDKLCSYGKKYPCCDCPDPCAEELKRIEFYDPSSHIGSDIEEAENKEADKDRWVDDDDW